MAQSKDDIKYGTGQAKLSEGESLRVRYKHGTPLESGKISDSQPVNLFSGAQRVSGPTAAKNDEAVDKSRPSPSPAAAAEEATSPGDGGGI